MLKITDLHVNYGAIKALKGISLEVKEGSIVTLIGANGAGKTTLLRTISSILNPVSGSIDFLGENIMNLAPNKIVEKGISQAPEGRMIFSNLTVKENLEMGAYVRNDKHNFKEDLEFIYTFFQGSRRDLNNPEELSGGEQQMLAISRALMSKPKLLLLDEPSLGIAPLLVKTIFEKIEALNKDTGLTILLVEQNANIALSIADYAYVMETGEIILEGEAKSLAKNEEVRKAYLESS
ncbi:MAG: ABC transporter ATP-binding protein [Ignavibacteria bacterium]